MEEIRANREKARSRSEEGSMITFCSAGGPAPTGRQNIFMEDAAVLNTQSSCIFPIHIG
jgi:hypothetical protein